MQFGVNKHGYIFFKDNKIARARRASAICSLKNLQVLITPNCRGNYVITCYNVHRKNIAEGQDRRNFKSVREIFVLYPRVTTMHLRYDFAVVLHENVLVFSQSEARNLFMYIINKVIYL